MKFWLFLTTTFLSVTAEVRCVDDLHRLMNSHELRHYFGVDNADHVDPEKYQVAEMFNVLHLEKEIAKRSGEKPPDAAYKVAVFGNTYNLRLKRNRNLLGANLIYTEVNGPRTKDILINNSSRLSLMESEDDDIWGGFSECDHFIGFGSALSECGDEGLRGFLFDNETYEVYPMPQRLLSKLNQTDRSNSTGSARGIPHLVKMADFPHDSVFQDNSGERLNAGHLHKRSKSKGKNSGKLFIETGLFLDAAAYKTYKYFYEVSGYSNPDVKIRDLLLSYMNSIQALYHFPSLGVEVDFSLVKMEIHKTQPADFPNYDGERGRLLTSFCDYQSRRNAKGDSNDAHWDIGLLVSGLDFWANEGSKKSYLTMGLATVTGICTDQYGCVIGEMGVRSNIGKPYPSTGFTSVYVMAHEIGHNLGMSHDSVGNVCDSNGYIMSPSRGTKGETVWSDCSRNHMTKLDLACLKDKPALMEADVDHNKYENYPGQAWDADTQCKTLLFDNDAKMDHTEADMHNVCYSLKCRSPNKIGYYRAGPALEGTPCGVNRVCQGGSCVKNNISPGVVSTATWSSWTFSSCQSGCITRSKGFINKSRTCIKDTPVSVGSTCPGNSREVQLCDNPKCQGYEVATNYAERMCKVFRKASKRLGLLIKEIGKQPKYNKDRVDLACTIHCRMTKNGAWYAPVLELNDRPDISVHFPDGTWCHNDGDTDYFCRKNKCESSSRGARAEKVPDLGISNNALPSGGFAIPKEMEKYFTLNEDEVPLNDNPHPEENNEAKEDAWGVIDYINLP